MTERHGFLHIEAENKLRRMVRMYLIMCLFAGISMTFTPLIKIAWTFVNGGTIKPMDWIIPYKVEYGHNLIDLFESTSDFF